MTMLEYQRIYCNASEMLIDNVDRVESIGTTYNSFPTYTVVSLCFWVEDESSRRDTAASEKVCPKLKSNKLLQRLNLEFSLTAY